MKGSKDIGVGLVSYKMDKEMINNLSDSLDNYPLAYKVVVDNSPTNNSKDSFIKRGWKYIHKKNNPGFGVSHNEIFDNFSHKSEFHLIVNPDVRFNSSILDELKNFLIDKSEAGAVAPAVYYPNGDFQNLRKLLPSPYGWFLRRFKKNSLELWHYNFLFEMQFAPQNGIFKIPYMSGCFMLLRNSTIRSIGLFDRKIFMYGEDTDLSRRLWINNTPPYYYGSVNITHAFAKGSHNSYRLLLIAIKSTIYYFNKWGWLDKNRKEINKNCMEQFTQRKSDFNLNR